MNQPRCPVDIEFGDVQGNVLTAYGKLGFPYGRFGLVSVANPKSGRAFVEALRHRITTAVRWPSHGMEFAIGRKGVPRPKVTINLAFTYSGLRALDVPTRTLRGMPDEFMDGMAARCDILGDNANENSLKNWDPVWDAPNYGRGVHILVTLNAQMQADGNPVPELAATCDEIAGLCPEIPDVEQVLTSLVRLQILTLPWPGHDEGPASGAGPSS